MKTLFTKNGVVIGRGATSTASISSVSSGTNSIDYVVPESTPAEVGWSVALVSGQPIFTAPTSLPLLGPMQFYLALSPAERIAIKTSSDPMVSEFWMTYQLSAQLNHPIDPNLTSVQGALNYLAAPVSPGPGAGILASTARVTQILAGIPQ